MTSEIIVAVIAALGGLSGSVIGMVRSSRLVNYRIDQLEKKVDAYEKARITSADWKKKWKHCRNRYAR